MHTGTRSAARVDAADAIVLLDATCEKMAAAAAVKQNLAAVHAQLELFELCELFEFFELLESDVVLSSIAFFGNSTCRPCDTMSGWRKCDSCAAG